ncbi:MAG: hypothetical protein NZL87_10250, partial [Thermomicrobium sp.]|nr:hypothetical protein [Thermomicrobium sp.]
VEVLGSREGWIRVRLSDGRVGYVDRALFDRLPPPVRENRGVLVLRLFAVDGAVPLRETRVDVRGLSDESHVTFSFAPVPDSYQVEYRFTVEAIDTESGRAVTLWGDPATGNLVFRPNYAPVVLAEASLDSGRWSGVQQTLEVRFPPISPTRETYLRLVIEARERPLIVHWSQVRPPGGLPLRSADDPGIWGGLVFNARFVDAIPVSAILRSGIARAVHLFAVDPPLLVAYSIVTVAVLASIAWSWRNGGRRAISP